MFWIKSHILLSIIFWAHLQRQTNAALNYYTIDEQLANFAEAFSECRGRQEEFSQRDYNATDLECPIDFDTAVCWPRTKANQTAVLQCPSYINKFDTSEKAYRYCTEHGNWSFDFERNIPRIDYKSCRRAAEALDTNLDVTGGEEIEMSPLVQAHIGRFRMMYTVGYSVSVISLIVALVVMLLLRRLHCPRNTIHMNMFVSFILRGGIQLLRELLHGTQSGVGIGMNGMTGSAAIEEDILATTGWQCKLLSTIWMYTRLSNCVWIFIEGIYLHTLIFINTFSDKSSIKWFILTGWEYTWSPILFVLPWMLVRVYLDDFRCWTVYKNRIYRWIIEVPIVLLIVVNFIFFLIIIRLLFTKLKASESRSREARIYRKLAKSTLVLIPLFGVHYVVFLFGEFFTKNDTLELIRFYFDTFFLSFQGLMVGVLFCFMNGEVRTEIIKKWKRWRTLQNMQLPSTSTQLNVTQRTSIGSEQESVTPNRDRSREASIQSKSSSSSTPPLQPLVEESLVLLSIDDNQNELALKLSSESDRVELLDMTRGNNP